MVEFALPIALVGVPLAVAVPKLATPKGMYRGFSRDAIAAFKHVLARAGIPATVRLPRGRDIATACGQLAVSG